MKHIKCFKILHTHDKLKIIHPYNYFENVIQKKIRYLQNE